MLNTNGTYRHGPADVVHGGQRVLVHVLVVSGCIPGTDVEGSEDEKRGFVRRDLRVRSDHPQLLQVFVVQGLAGLVGSLVLGLQHDPHELLQFLCFHGLSEEYGV